MLPGGKNYITYNHTDTQLVEPRNHHVNAAEVALKAVKHHTLAHLATIDPDCPIQLWCKFVRQIQITLLLLQTSRVDNKKSAYEALYHKKFNFNITPITTIGAKAVAFISQDDRNSWQAHAVDAWYTGPAPDHYPLLDFFNPTTGGIIHTGTYQIFPAYYCAIPTISEGHLTLVAAADLRLTVSLLAKK